MSALTDTPTQPAMTSAAVATSSKTESGSGSAASFEAVCRPEIKHEPPEEIVDVPCGASGVESCDSERSNSSPKIRLTPTIKLMATPNPVDPKRKFACPYENCTKSYGKSSHLRSHLTWHTGIKPFVCQAANCGKGFTRSDELNRHVRTHTGEKPFECIQCTKKFSRSDHLTKHLATHMKQMQQHSPKRPRRNNNTDNSPKKDEGTTEHMDLSDGFHFMASLIEARAEAEAAREIIIPDPTTEAQTTEAQIPIKIKLERPDHDGEYHVVPALKYYPKRPSISDTEKRSATDGKVFPTTSIIPEAAYVPKVAKVENCAIDTKLNAERPFSCTQCTKCFKRQDDLNRHVRTHTGEKPFACVECERRFMRRDHLMKHVKTHIKLR